MSYCVVWWDSADISEEGVAATSVRKVEKAEYDNIFLVVGGMPWLGLKTNQFK
jgi:hypothetical protein